MADQLTPLAGRPDDRWLPGRSRTARALAALVVGALLVAALGSGVTRLGRAPGAIVSAAAKADATLFLGAPATLDPARQGDAGSAAITAQLFESLTTFDSSLTLRPALAEAWQVDQGGRRVTFTLRPGLAFSDGSALTASDVVRSWLRVIDPRQPSPLASLMDPVAGATAYRRGQGDAASVGLHAPDAQHVIVDLDQPAADFPAVVASPTFGVVPPGVGEDGASGLQPGDFVASGGYRLTAVTGSELTLSANERYWAGTPALRTIHLLTTIGGRSPVDAFEAGDVDYTDIGDADATWIAYDRSLGPQLRQVPSLSVVYFGFDTSRAPFDDADVRRAFAQAVDWKRIVELGSGGSATPATSMVPAGVPGRSSRDFSPGHDVAAARAALARAGFPGGAGFPPIVLVTAGTGYEEAIVRELHDALGITVSVETMPFDEYVSRLSTDPPAFWSLSWVADYPGPNDFLGLLLGTGQTNDYGRWSDAEFDADIARARATSDPAAQADAYAAAEAVVQREAPVVPVAYASGWALARDGLLGAGQNGLGILRMAGMAWRP